jgi:outer membrane protein OmpA-like peptidoglycan-associated protein
MKKIFFSLVCFFPVFCFSQSLLLNGGFEEENICTEFKINCAPEAWITSGSGLANYFKDINRVYEGEHCMAIVAGHVTRPFDRTFIRSPLLCRLKRGNQYRLEFFIKSPHPILDSIGVYFGPIDPLLERKPIHLLAPSLFLGRSNKFVKDSNWQKVVLDYRANGNEAYITIANFSRNDVTGNTGISRRNQFFVLIDNISLLPLNPEERLCANWQQVKEDIYDLNERHQYLQRMITQRSSNDPDKIIPGPTMVVVADTLLLPDVLFATGKKELQPASFALLDSFCNKMANRSIDSLVIEGHADNTGTVTFNEQLSSDRAASAASYLARCMAFSRATVITRGWGSRKPVALNDSPVNRQKNRRVELLVYFREVP